MKIPQIPPLAGMTPLGVKPKPEAEWPHKIPKSGELFEAPFNLAGEPLDNSVGAEGQARAQAQAQAEARKAQIDFIYERENGNAKIEAERVEYEN